MPKWTVALSRVGCEVAHRMKYQDASLLLAVLLMLSAQPDMPE